MSKAFSIQTLICSSTIIIYLANNIAAGNSIYAAYSPVLWTNYLFPNSTFYGDGFQVRAILSIPLLGLENINSVKIPAVVCGFFCNLNCDSFVLATLDVYIASNFSVTTSPDPPRLLWSANSDHSISENSTLDFSQDGNLVLRDGNGMKVWSTETANRSVVGMKLTESGSLVLFDKNNITVWDSGKGPKDQSLAATLDPIALALFAAFVTIGFFILLIRLNLDSKHEKDEDDFGLVPGLPTRFQFEELRVATNNFCRKLGHGGFGSVFEGTLNGQRVAVKRLDGAGQGIKQFLAEVMTVGNIHHINLVRLIGFCSEKSNRLLVYEYMSKGSLDKWIFSKNQGVALDWETRCSIIIGVAKGLSYLHEECRDRIAHLDIKPQNILLDDKFQAKISDFGLSMLIDRERSHVSTTTRGTRGYMAPEWLRSRITEKADVYSFGIVVMEILCGRKNLDYSQPEECVHLVSMLENMVHENRLLELVDDHSNDVHLHGNEVIEMMKLAMWCLQVDSSRRPSMSVVVKVLEGSANVETNIDYNFTDPTLQMGKDAHNLGISPPPLASILSIGR